MSTPEILGAHQRRPVALLVTAMTLAGLLLTGCGQKGPLYLPAPGQTEKPARVKEVPPEVVTDPMDNGADAGTSAAE